MKEKNLWRTARVALPKALEYLQGLLKSFASVNFEGEAVI